MIVNEMLKLINSTQKCNVVLDHTTDGGFWTGSLKFYRVNLNIVHILKDRVYLGKGYIIETEDELHRHLNNNSFKHITYTSRPVLITTLNNKDMKLFIDLLKYEKSVLKNIKINIGDYSRWIQNDIPYQISCANEERYYSYELRQITYYKETENNGVIVNLFLDNYDVEDFVDYYIPEPLSNVQKDLDRIGDYNGELSSYKNCLGVIKI